MKKFVILIVVLGFMLIAKLNYDMWQISTQIPQLQEKILKSEQNNANLNDQLVALKRQLDADGVVTSPKQPVADTVVAGNPPRGVDPVFVIRQHSELIQFALQQQAYVYALEQLNRLDQQVEGYSLAPALKLSLHEVLAKDRQNIQQFLTARAVQKTTLDGLLSQVDRLLGAELKQQPSPAKQQPQYFWEKWLQVEHVEQRSADLVNRKLILKEVQLRLVLARQALLQGQYLEYQQVLGSVIEQLDALPDANSQQLKQRLIKAKNLPVLPAPKLNISAVLGGE